MTFPSVLRCGVLFWALLLQPWELLSLQLTLPGICKSFCCVCRTSQLEFHFSPSRNPYDLSKLGSVKLVRLDDSKEVVSASELWGESGAVIMIVRRPG